MKNNNQQKITTALEWWNALRIDDKIQLAVKHQIAIDNDYPEGYPEDKVVNLYEMEHPTTEVDLLNGITKGEWENRGNQIFVKDTYISICQVHVKNNYKPITFEPIEDVEAIANQNLLLNAPLLAKENKRLNKTIDDLLETGSSKLSQKIKNELAQENKLLKEEIKRLKKEKYMTGLLSCEFGYKQCENGENIQATIMNFKKLMEG